MAVAAALVHAAVAVMIAVHVAVPVAWAVASPVSPGRGFGDGQKRLEHRDFGLLDRSAWWYDWGLNPEPAAGSFAQEFVAMVRAVRLYTG